MRTWQPHTTRVNSMVFSPDGKLLATTAGQSKVVWFWDATTGSALRVFDWGVGVLAEACFAPDGLTCAVGSAKGKVVVWDLDV